VAASCAAFASIRAGMYLQTKYAAIIDFEDFDNGDFCEVLDKKEEGKY
jgi:hypothetical protein